MIEPLQLAQTPEIAPSQWSWVSAWDGEAWALAAMYAVFCAREWAVRHEREVTERVRIKHEDGDP